jgi:outer membrane biosynthesis protein TonB
VPKTQYYDITVDYYNDDTTGTPIANETIQHITEDSDVAVTLSDNLGVDWINAHLTDGYENGELQEALPSTLTENLTIKVLYKETATADPTEPAEPEDKPTPPAPPIVEPDKPVPPVPPIVDPDKPVPPVPPIVDPDKPVPPVPPIVDPDKPVPPIDEPDEPDKPATPDKGITPHSKAVDNNANVSAKTGDNNPWIFYFTLSALSILVVSVIVRARLQKRKDL